MTANARNQARARPNEAAVDDSQRSPSLKAVFEAEYKFVWRSLLHLGVPEAAVDDALQDVFVVVHRKLDEFDTARSIRSWLWGIARRVARDHRRNAARIQRRLSVVTRPEPAPSPEDEAARREASTVVAEFLSSLGEDQRDVFVLAELEEMTAPEIANALGVKVNTVYSRLRTARLRFKRAVERFRARAQRRRST